MYPQYMCILLYGKFIGVMVFHRSIVNWNRGYMYTQYICIPLYVELIWCISIPYMYSQLECEGVDVSLVYVHSAICETYLV